MFDCDNTLVLSEDVASEICCDLINEILGKKSTNVKFSSEILISDFVGLSFRRILVILQQQYGFHLNEEEMKMYSKIHGDRVDANIRKKAIAPPGVAETLARLHQLDKFVLAVASSSSLRRIRTCLEVTDLIKFFDDDKIFSAADSVPVPSSKPNPAVYLHAIEKLGAEAEECLAVEDSMSGTRAALGANLRCLGYVGSTHGPAKKTEMARHLLNAGCQIIMWHWGNYGRHLAGIEGEEKEHAERLKLLQGAGSM